MACDVRKTLNVDRHCDCWPIELPPEKTKPQDNTGVNMRDAAPAMMKTTDSISDIVLRDGSTLAVRRAQEGDTPAIVRFFEGLSRQSLYQRFLNPVKVQRSGAHAVDVRVRVERQRPPSNSRRVQVLRARIPRARRERYKARDGCSSVDGRGVRGGTPAYQPRQAGVCTQQPAVSRSHPFQVRCAPNRRQISLQFCQRRAEDSVDAREPSCLRGG